MSRGVVKRETKLSGKAAELGLGQGFCKDVCNIVFARAMLKCNSALFNLLPQIVVLGVKVLGTRGDHVKGGNIDGRCIVTVNGSWLRWQHV